MVLGDHFPQEWRDGFVSGGLAVGSILYLRCSFTTPPKPKYLFVACLDPKPLAFVINTNINAFKQARPSILRCQVTLDAQRHGFLNHDSYVDCWDCHVLYPTREDLEEALAEDIAALKGQAHEDVLAEVLAATKAAETLTRKHQRWIISALER